ncbi:hypothetical protein OG21DRAFT_1484651 [Imleria badia]|nr:hypothetical protein OG21DRAFT_1484651 [Imleria badia]
MLRGTHVTRDCGQLRPFFSDNPSPSRGGVFQVRISKTETVVALKEAIKNKKLEAFHDVDADTLSLYKPRNPVPTPVRGNLSKIILSEHAERLQEELSRLSQVFPEPLPEDRIHIIVDAPYFIIYYWLRNGTFNNGFERIIRSNATINELKHEIKSSMKDVHEDHISLYRIPGDENAVRESLTKTGGGEPLQGRTLAHIFLRVPVFDTLYVVVEVTLRGEKRAREEADEIREALKRARIANHLPSDVGKPSVYREVHTKDYLIDHRRACDDESPDLGEKLPPISLQYAGFGHFLDIFYGHEHFSDTDKVSSREIRTAVDTFAERMSRYYPAELSRRDDGLPALKNVLSARTDGLSFRLLPGEVDGSVRSDGHIYGPHNAMSCVTKFKNEAGGVSTIPYVEMLGYFAHSTKTAAKEPDSASLMDAWNFPCLGMTIIGHQVTFYAMIYFGEWRVVSLTPSLSCVECAGDGNERNALYDAFTAASVLLACIHQDAKRFIETPSRLSLTGRRRLPYISSLFDPDSRSRIEFHIVDPFSSGLDRFLYIARTSKGEIIVKFTRRYSYDLHTFCAGKGFAPKLLGFERLPGGFFGVAMELFEDASPFTAARGPKTAEWKKELKKLVNSFHDVGLVHGDLRSPNILCDGNKVMLVDFDWGGKQGEVSYPKCKLNRELENERNMTNLKITFADDRRVLEKTLDRVV